MNEPLFWIAPLAAVLAMVFAWRFFTDMLGRDEGTEAMQRIGAYVRRGSLAYLRQQYRIMIVVFAGLAALFAFLAYGLGVQSPWLPLTFIAGGFFSALAGYFGMQTATQASTRTTAAARSSLPQALSIAFRSGAVMGLVVVGLGLGNLVVWFVLIDFFTPGNPADGTYLVLVTTTVLTFGMGASLQALFARVGGGIYTKAADVGADLVGKVEAGIPEDDPRNPAVIADNVGDNVGDVAGMGADLFESYVGSILAASALGAAAYVSDPAMQMKAVVAPLMIAGIGIILSICGRLPGEDPGGGRPEGAARRAVQGHQCQRGPHRRGLGRRALHAPDPQRLGCLGGDGDGAGHRYRDRPLHRVLHLGVLCPDPQYRGGRGGRGGDRGDRRDRGGHALHRHPRAGGGRGHHPGLFPRVRASRCSR